MGLWQEDQPLLLDLRYPTIGGAHQELGEGWGSETGAEVLGRKGSCGESDVKELGDLKEVKETEEERELLRVLHRKAGDVRFGRWEEALNMSFIDCCSALHCFFMPFTSFFSLYFERI